MNIVKRILIIMSLVIVPALSVGTVSAGPFSGSKSEACKGANLTNSGGNACSNQNAAGNISTTLQRIINILTVIVGIAAVIAIIINGLKFITSSGDSNAISSAKNGIIYAIVGLIIVALSQVIVRFIINRVYE